MLLHLNTSMERRNTLGEKRISKEHEQKEMSAWEHVCLSQWWSEVLNKMFTWMLSCKPKSAYSSRRLLSFLFPRNILIFIQRQGLWCLSIKNIIIKIWIAFNCGSSRVHIHANAAQTKSEFDMSDLYDSFTQTKVSSL